MGHNPNWLPGSLSEQWITVYVFVCMRVSGIVVEYNMKSFRFVRIESWAQKSPDNERMRNVLWPAIEPPLNATAVAVKLRTIFGFRQCTWWTKPSKAREIWARARKTLAMCTNDMSFFYGILCIFMVLVVVVVVCLVRIRRSISSIELFAHRSCLNAIFLLFRDCLTFILPTDGWSEWMCCGVCECVVRSISRVSPIQMGNQKRGKTK